jgi:hypothetical protein
MDVFPIGVDLLLGFAWGAGGVNNVAVYSASSVFPISGVGIETRQPFQIPDGFPGLVGNRIFLDVMGGCVGRSHVDVDFKIYSPTGQTPVYQAPTVSASIWGGLLVGFTINSVLRLQGGRVGSSAPRQFAAGILGLLSLGQIPRRAQDAAALRRHNECLDNAGSYQMLGPGGGLGRALYCLGH